MCGGVKGSRQWEMVAHTRSSGMCPLSQSEPVHPFSCFSAVIDIPDADREPPEDGSVAVELLSAGANQLL